ncbi:MAG: hypothetical protein WBD28_08705 [Candidatus Zixiibacteriota bacterium]
MEYKVSKFSLPNLCNSFSNEHVSPVSLENDRHIKYLFGYLQELHCKTIIVEKVYVDGDYLDDFSKYYVKCFRPYDRFCKRIHFFSQEFDQKYFNQLAKGELIESKERQLLETYIGFAVAKPLPETVIGRTVLVTYPPDNFRRYFPSIRTYHAHLLGLCFCLKSLAFQEQDTVVAACATTALWSALQKTAELFGTEAPSPSRVTEYATSHFVTSRPIPSHGLNVNQICQAIREVGLEPEVFPITGRIPVTSLTYSYLKAGLPVIFGLDIKHEGKHAVTVAGYSLENKKLQDREVHKDYKSISFKGLYVSKFYVHDDQIGPFSRLHICPGQTVRRGTVSVKVPVRFTGSWLDKAGRPLYMDPLVLIIPIYHKIRLNFLDVIKKVNRIEEFFESIGWVAPSGPLKLEWDIYLTNVSSFKMELASIRQNSPAARTLIDDFHPRFIWRVRCFHDKLPLFEILADATDMARSFFFYRFWYLYKPFQSWIASLIQTQHGRILVERYLSSKFLDLLKNGLGD